MSAPAQAPAPPGSGVQLKITTICSRLDALLVDAMEVYGRIQEERQQMHDHQKNVSAPPRPSLRGQLGCFLAHCCGLEKKRIFDQILTLDCLPACLPVAQGLLQMSMARKKLGYGAISAFQVPSADRMASMRIQM